MSKKAVQDSLRPALLVLMMTAVSGCGQPTTVSQYTTRWFTESPLPEAAGVPGARRSPVALGFAETEIRPISSNSEVRSDPQPHYTPAFTHAIERMSSGFQFPELRHPRLDRQIAWYQRNSNSLRNSLNRADPFIAWILDQLEAQQLPTELALIPVIESGYQPSALSPNRAAGLWQFIPSTGNRFGLEQNRWYDGRRDVVDSTQAALEYFAFLRDEFDGDWLLALAAYNSGEGTVARAIQRNRQRGLPTDVLSLDLPQHTQEYVLKLLALRDIVVAPGHYGIKLPELEATTQIALIETSGKLDLGQAASMAGLSLADVQRLNPGLRRTTTPPQGPHRLVVPLAAANRFAAHLTERAATIDVAEPPTIAQTSAPSERSDRTHRVRAGETLWSLARRYGSTVQRLAKLNGIGADAALHTGQTLRIDGNAASDRDKRTAKVLADSRPAASVKGEPQSVRYTVRRGDSLIQISRRYRVTINDLRKWNGLRPDQYLQPGQKLTLYLDTSMRAEGGG